MYSGSCYHRSCANHRFCAAGFCSFLFRQRCLAFPCSALPRRHRSPVRPPLGCQPQCLAYQLLCAFFSLLYVGDFFLGRLRPSICADWYELWRDSWLARSGDNPLGKTIGRTFLHAEPLARTSGYPRNCGTFCVRLVACCALRPFRRTAFFGCGLRNAAFSGSRSRVNRLLPRLFYWSADPHCASRASGRRLNVASVGSEPLAHAATGIRTIPGWFSIQPIFASTWPFFVCAAAFEISRSVCAQRIWLFVHVPCAASSRSNKS